MKSSKVILVLTLFFLLLIFVPESDAQKRSATVRRHFLHSINLVRTPPGCQVDHMKPLFCGGADTESNLWLTCGALSTEKEGLERQRRCDDIQAWVAAHPHAGIRPRCEK